MAEQYDHMNMSVLVILGHLEVIFEVELPSISNFGHSEKLL